MDDQILDAVLALAARPTVQASAGISELGPASVTEVLLREIADRARLLPGPDAKVPLQWELQHLGEVIPFVMTVGCGQADFEPGRVNAPDVIVRQQLAELLTAVYGESGRHDATRELVLNAPDGPPGSDPDGSDRRRREGAVAAARLAVQATSSAGAELVDLALRARTDKWGRHWYPDHYDRHFRQLRQTPVRLLEFGCDEGESLDLWTHYFRRGRMLRVDSREKTLAPPQRATVRHGLQNDEAFLDQLARLHGPFDVIIDDGSHLNDHVLVAFTQLFRHLSFGGLYVIEDIGASYWPGWGGSSSELDSPATTVGFVKTLLDGLNHQQLVRDHTYEPSDLDRHIKSVTMHHNIVFIEKGLNTERGAPAWVSRSPTALFL